MRLLVLLIPLVAMAGPPVITELKPRGAEKGRPFTLTVMGRDIPSGARVWSTMPATFTPVVSERGAQFLVEPKSDIAPGVYPVRLETTSGITNVLLFSIGAFPELNELESEMYSAPNRNDSIETAETVETVPVTINGTLRGPERDLFRIHGKAGETRVFEVEARRCGSAIDPVIRILSPAGKQLARSDDAFGAGLDARLEFTFPAEGYYYVELHDARFSRQGQNFYRLKMGSYPFADGIFPLGGQRGKPTAVTFFGGNLKAPVKSAVDVSGLGDHAEFATAALPGSGELPFLFAVSDEPEFVEPTAAVAAPAVINGRLMKPAQIDRYKVDVQPGEFGTTRFHTRHRCIELRQRHRRGYRNGSHGALPG